MRVYLIRHGQPQVDAGICYGGTDLDVAPQEHERVLAEVKPALPAGAPVLSSPLRRCRDLAEQLAAALGSGAVEYDKRLMEMHFGAWEMRAWDAIPCKEIDAWAEDLLGYCPPGGETVLQMAERVWLFYAELLRRSDEQVIVVCHAGTIRLLQQCRKGVVPAVMASEAARRAHRIAYGQMLTLDC